MAPENAERRDLGAMTDEERDAYGAALMQMRIDFEQAMAAPGGWQEADQRLRPLLDGYPEVERYKVHQTAGTMILNTYLLSGEVDVAKAEALGFYTDKLTEYGSPNAPLVERALVALDAHWTDEKISATAIEAVIAGDRFVAAQAARESRSEHDARRRVASSGAHSARADQVAAAVDRLRTLAH